jgi:electron transport complex protein RnfD
VSDKIYLSSSPHVHCGLTTNAIMRQVIYALMPATLLSVLFFGVPAISVLLFCVGGAVATEAICQKMMKRPLAITDGSAFLTGQLLALNMPPSSSWWICLLGAVIAITVAKQFYGGLGHNPFNPALVARVVLLISFPVQMTVWTAPSFLSSGFDAVTKATPLGEMKTAVMLTGKLPPDIQSNMFSYFTGNMAGSMGEVSAIALLLGGIYLIAKRIITWHIPTIYLLTVIVFGGIFWLVDSTKYPDPIFHLMTGSLILGAFFMATDMVTSPVSTKGMVVFAVGCGLITVLIRLFGGYPEGVSFAILLMNAGTPLIDRLTVPKKFGLHNAKGVV